MANGKKNYTSKRGVLRFSMCYF